MLKSILRWLVVGLLATAVLISALYVRDISRAYERVRGKSKLIASPYGNIEYTEGGTGPVVLVIHGSGGGYDQGELIVQTVLNDQFHWIAPSRFGYLRSTFNEGATFEDQAHAYAYLLDQLGIQKVAVVAFSHGGPSALFFAALHPERVSSLSLISCGVAPATTGVQQEADAKGKMLVRIFESDFLYWSATQLFEKQFMGLMGATDSVVAGLTAPQRELVVRIIDYMNPVSLRSAGAAFDNTRPVPGAKIAAIRAPTLIVHATDDTLQLFHNAEFAAAHIPGARLVRYDRGGHLLAMIEQPTISRAVQAHILGYMDGSAPEQ